jgi:DNA-binding LacI/PurR family transcriptional regulator
MLEGRAMNVLPELIGRADFSADNALTLLHQTMDQGLAFDAVFTNDEMAIGVLRALHERGKRVPEDVAVAGCDGLPIGLQTVPSLTTVALDYAQLGQAAVEKVLAERPADAPPSRVKLLPKLVVRESTSGLTSVGGE